MLVILIIAIFIVFFILWNTTLLFYKDRNVETLKDDEDKIFSERCKSIYYNTDNEEAVLLIHGFPTCPQMYEYACARLREDGFAVYAPKIPTFGTDYDEFSKTTFTQWFNYISSFYEDVRKKHKKVYVLGVSMGGAMTLKIAEKYSDTTLSPDKIIVIAAPVVYNSFRYRVWTSVSTYLARTVSLFTPHIGAKYVKGNPSGEDGNEDWTGYGGTFIKQGISLIHNLKFIKKELYKVKVPIYSLHDTQDTTVPFKNQEIILNNIASKKVVKRVATMQNYNHSKHSLLMYKSVQKEYLDDIIKFIKGDK